MENKHVPVMLKEVIEYLDPREGQNFIDCTLGGGGYTFAIAELVGAEGRVIGIDMDKDAIENVQKKINKNKHKNIILAHDNFKNLHKIVRANRPAGTAASKVKKSKEVSGFSGIVLDLGLSSNQLEDRDRGFSFQLDAPLDMRFAHTRIAVDKTHPVPPGHPSQEGIRAETNYGTEDIINKWPVSEIEGILREYGEERYARSIARGIGKARVGKLITTTGELVNIIKAWVPPIYKNNKRLHFATKTFQALRIATNRELDNLEKVLPRAVKLLKQRGRVAVISYHSLEDRIVKRFFKLESRECICPPEIPVCVCEHLKTLKIITRKVLRPGEDEIKANPRARSAKMRVAEKIYTPLF